MGFTTMGSLKRKANVGTIALNGIVPDTSYTTRTYQPGGICIYTKSTLFIHEIGEYSRGTVSFPVNFGLSHTSHESSNFGPSKTVINLEYDVAALYGVAGGSCVPDYNGYSNTGYSVGLGIGMVGLTHSPYFESESRSKPTPDEDINFVRNEDDNSLFNKINIGPVLHAGLQTQFLSFFGDFAQQGIALTLRPGFGKSFSYLQVSFYMTMN